MITVNPLSDPQMKLENSRLSRKFDVNLDYFYLNNYKKLKFIFYSS